MRWGGTNLASDLRQGDWPLRQKADAGPSASLRRLSAERQGWLWVDRQTLTTSRLAITNRAMLLTGSLFDKFSDNCPREADPANPLKRLTGLLSKRRKRVDRSG